MLYVTSGEYGYFETIQAFFLELTGKGLVLSSRDIETLKKWADQGASAATVCGHRASHRRFGRKTPRYLGVSSLD